LTIKTIAIISPGDMGSGIGKVLVQEGYQVLTCLEGRSTLTKELAQKAGFQDTPNLATLLSQADCLISIVPPESALSVAQGAILGLDGTQLASDDSLQKQLLYLYSSIS